MIVLCFKYHQNRTANKELNFFWEGAQSSARTKFEYLGGQVLDNCIYCVFPPQKWPYWVFGPKRCAMFWNKRKHNFPIFSVNKIFISSFREIFRQKMLTKNIVLLRFCSKYFFLLQNVIFFFRSLRRLTKPHSITKRLTKLPTPH